MDLTINLFGTLFEIKISAKVTKKVPKYATVKPNTTWIYAGHRLKVESVYMQESHFDEPGSGRYLRLSLRGTAFESKHKNTVIQEKDLVLHY